MQAGAGAQSGPPEELLCSLLCAGLSLTASQSLLTKQRVYRSFLFLVSLATHCHPRLLSDILCLYS